MPQYLHIGSHNIQGNLAKKFNFVDVVNDSHRFDIFCIQETWLTDNYDIVIPGYHIFRSDRKKNKRKNCGSGGVAILFKKSLEKGLKKIESKNNDLLWVKLDKKFFGMDSDLFLCSCYIPPENSPMHNRNKENIFDTLQAEIERFSVQGEIILIGDFNSRTGTLCETFYEPENDTTINHGIPDSIEYDTLVNEDIPERYNTDKTINQFGKKLLSLANKAHLVITNGRKIGDMQGHGTCYTNKGVSTIDYCITTRNLFNSILNFQVLNQTWYSDHSPISVKIRATATNAMNPDFENLNSYSKYIINEQNKINYKNYFATNQETITQLNSLLASTNNDTTTATRILNEIIYEVANATLVKKSYSPTIKKDNPTKPKTQNHEQVLNEVKSTFNKNRKKYVSDKANINRRILYLSAKRKYKKLKYLLFKKDRDNRLYELAELEKKDPKQFWQGVKKIISNKKVETNMINADSWVTYFSKLLNLKETNSMQYLNYINECLPTIEKNFQKVGPLDYLITEKELNKHIVSLKSGKSAGPDRINNDMIKLGGSLLHSTIRKILNDIIKSGNYPNQWKENYIVPVHKSDKLDDPTNYRGIALANCLGKLLNKVLYDRIYSHLTKNNFWSPYQNGFMKNSRTEDNIFTLQTIIQKYVKKQKKKIYVAFIDLKKFFDTINRNILLYKLIKAGIVGNIYKIIKNAYSDITYSVKTQFGITKSFTSTAGVKQGCNLSSMLSNIYQNDLHEIFVNCDPVLLDNLKISSLSWADDLVVISQSKEGLQQALNKLNDYCNKNCLTVNVNKTKCMVVSNAKDTTTASFTFNNEVIDFVNCYKYLGLVISSNGNMHKMVEDRITKANRALFMIKQAMGDSLNTSLDLSLTIFDKKIEPILLYGCPIWGVPQCNNYLRLHSASIPVKVKEHAKQILSIYSDKDINILWCKADRVNNSILVKLESIDDKIRILENRNKSIGPCLFEDHTCQTQTLNYEKVQTNFCKSLLHVPRSKSNHLVLSELGRFPLKNKAIRLAIQYWLRLANNQGGYLVSKAYNTCIEEQHPWAQNIFFELCKNGLRYIWDNPHALTKSYVKSKLLQRLNDQYIQQSSDYTSRMDHGKILFMCNNGMPYGQKPYLTLIRNTYIRQCVINLRIDNSNLADCLYRNPKLKIDTRVCSECNETEDVEHFLVKCKRDNLVKIRETLKIKLEKYGIYNFWSLNNSDIVKNILNVDSINKKIIDPLCSFIKEMYNSRFINNSNDVCVTD